MKSQIRLLAKTCHFFIIEYVLKDKYTNEVKSEVDIITNFSTQKIIWQNKCLMRFLDRLVLKHDFDKKLMMNAITCSNFDPPSTFYDDDIYNGISKSMVLEPTIVH